MPTWRNDNAFSVKVVNISGEGQTVFPNKQVPSYRDLTAAGFTQVSPVPYPNNILFNDLIHFSGESTVNRDVLRKAINAEVYCRSGEVKVHFESALNTPEAALLPAGRSVEFGVDELKGVSRLVFVSAGVASIDFHAEKELEGR